MNNLQIDVSNQEKEAIWQAFHEKNPSRVPVMLVTNPRVFLLDSSLNEQGITVERYFTDPATMIEAQLQYNLHLAQVINRYCDSPVGLPDKWTVYVDNQNVGEAAYLGAEIHYRKGQVPATTPFCEGENKEAIFSKDITRPLTQGFYHDRLVFYARMVEITQNMTFMDRPIEVIPYAFSGTDGPVTAAMNVRGTEFMADLILDPDYANRLMGFITEAAILSVQAFRTFWGNDEGGKLADDSIQLISTEMYREMVLPHHRHYLDTLKPDRPRSIHLCGDATRHFKTIHDELNVVEFDTGFPVDFGKLRRELGPDVLIYGGVEVALLLDATPKEVYERAKSILLSGIKEGGRFILRDANNLPPCVPEENMAAMYQACLDYGEI